MVHLERWYIYYFGYRLSYVRNLGLSLTSQADEQNLNILWACHIVVTNLKISNFTAVTFLVALFSCPADSSIGDLVTHSLSEWVSDLFKNTTNERPQRLVSFETFDQSDEKTWPDPKKDNDKDKYKDKDNDKDKYI